jgi:hypothetical protein
MNPDYIKHSLVDNTLNSFAFRTRAENVEPYLELKKLNNSKKWDPIFQPYDLNKHLEVKYLGNLPYDHGQYNDREHYNTYSNKNYIPPAYRINELYPSVGILSSVFKNR